MRHVGPTRSEIEIRDRREGQEWKRKRQERLGSWTRRWVCLGFLFGRFEGRGHGYVFIRGTGLPFCERYSGTQRHRCKTPSIRNRRYPSHPPPPRFNFIYLSPVVSEFLKLPLPPRRPRAFPRACGAFGSAYDDGR